MTAAELIWQLLDLPSEMTVRVYPPSYNEPVDVDAVRGSFADGVAIAVITP